MAGREPAWCNQGLRSLARPGGNVTGNTILGPEVVAKRLQILKEAVPSLSRVALLWNPKNASNAHNFVELQATVPGMGLSLNFLKESRLPGMFQVQENLVSGGFISYGASLPDLFRRGASYVHKILQGTKPADLPVEQPTKFDLVINLKTAKALGLTIPPTLVGRADEVVE